MRAMALSHVHLHCSNSDPKRPSHGHLRRHLLRSRTRRRVAALAVLGLLAGLLPTLLGVTPASADTVTVWTPAGRSAILHGELSHFLSLPTLMRTASMALLFGPETLTTSVPLLGRMSNTMAPTSATASTAAAIIATLRLPPRRFGSASARSTSGRGGRGDGIAGATGRGFDTGTLGTGGGGAGGREKGAFGASIREAGALSRAAALPTRAEEGGGKDAGVGGGGGAFDGGKPAAGSGPLNID